MNEAPAPLAAVAAANAIPDVDGWFMIAPYGETPNTVVGDDGRPAAATQVFDRAAADAIVAEHRGLLGRVGRLFQGLPIYMGHPDYAPRADEYRDKEIYGRLNQLDVRADGLYGRAKWTPEGKAMVNEKEVRFQSPHWGMAPIPGRPGAMRPVVLWSLGLTNNPNLPVPPLPAVNEPPANQATIMNRKKLAELLGLKPAAGATEVTDEQVEQAIRALTDQLAAAKTKSSTLEQSLGAANARATAAEATAEAAAAARNDLLVGAAVNSARIPEADRARWTAALAGDFPRESARLAALAPAMNTASRTAALGARQDELARGAGRVAAINEAVQRHMNDTGEADYTLAFLAVKRLRPALFAEEPAA